MGALDRRELLDRAGAAALAAALLPSGDSARAALKTRRPRDGLRELDRALRGSVVERGSAGYGRARLLFNTRFDAARPRAVVFAETADDVAKTVRWARRHGVRIVPRAGGHSYAGYSTSPGVVVDVTRMNAVRADVPGRTAVVGAGANLADVYAALWRRRLAIPGGSCPTVGIAGLTLGGGVGFASGKLGLTCDNLRRLTIATADARIRTCSPREHADLFWACRGGGGGNFGIVTAFEFGAHPVGDVAWYRIEWPWRDAARAVAAWQAWAPHAPDELFSVLQLAATERKGSPPVAGSSGQFFGSEAELRRLVAPLVDAGAPTRVTVRTTSYMAATLMWAGCRGPLERCRVREKTPGRKVERWTFKGKSHYAKRPLSSDANATLVRLVEARRSDPSLGRGSVLLDSYGGAIARVPKAATAFVHRDALFSLQYLAFWDRGAPARVVAANLRWLRGFHAAMRPHVSDGAYVNYADPDLRDWPRAYYGPNYSRLRRVKRRYDPASTFRFPQSVRPA